MRVQRTEVELLSTRSIVRSQWALLTKMPESAKAAFEGYQAYAEAMFPFLERARSTSISDEQRLLEHVKYPMQIDMSSIRHQRAEQARSKALRKFSTRRK